MDIDKRVTSWEISKKLKELGVKQDSLWIWKNVSIAGTKFDLIYKPDIAMNTPSVEYSAFTVAELGEMLPSQIGEDYDLPFKQHGKWRVNVSYVKELFYTFDTEADARGKMLCYLIKKRLIKPDE